MVESSRSDTTQLATTSRWALWYSKYHSSISSSELIDTTTSGGKLVFHIFGALAKFERELIRERAKAGLAAACVRGRQGGRPRKLEAKKIAIAQALYEEGTHSIADICQTLGVSRETLYRAIKMRDQTDGSLSEIPLE